NNALSRMTGRFFQKYDLLLTPTLARIPAPLGEIDQNKQGLDAFGWTRQVFAYCPFTPLFNSTGQPAISLPMHWSEGGVPVGVQLAGRFADEATLIRIASQLEQARPWTNRKPKVHSSN